MRVTTGHNKWIDFRECLQETLVLPWVLPLNMVVLLLDGPTNSGSELAGLWLSGPSNRRHGFHHSLGRRRGLGPGWVPYLTTPRTKP